MSEEKMMRLSQVARQLNVGALALVEHLVTQGIVVENNPNSKITKPNLRCWQRSLNRLAKKQRASGLTLGKKKQPESKKNQGDKAVGIPGGILERRTNIFRS